MRQRSLRLPDEWWEWLDNLPEDYGRDTTDKIRTLLVKGAKRIEQEQRWIREGEERERGDSGKRFEMTGT